MVFTKGLIEHPFKYTDFIFVLGGKTENNLTIKSSDELIDEVSLAYPFDISEMKDKATYPVFLTNNIEEFEKLVIDG